MKYAVSNIHYFYFSWDFFLQAAEKNGFKEIDVYGSMPHIWIDHYTCMNAECVEKTIAKHGLKPVMFTPKNYNYNIYAPDEIYSGISMKYYKNCVKFASEVGISNMAITLPEGYLDYESVKLYENAVSRIRNLSVYAEQRNINLLLETSACRFLKSIEDMQMLLADINENRIGLSINMKHIKDMNEEINLWLQKFGSRIKYVRVSDKAEKDKLDSTDYEGMRGVFVSNDALWDDPEKVSTGIFDC